MFVKWVKFSFLLSRNPGNYIDNSNYISIQKPFSTVQAHLFCGLHILSHI